MGGSEIKNRKILLVSSILVIIGIALLFLGAMTHQNYPGVYATAERERAYLEIASGFIFMALGVVVFFIYGKIGDTMHAR